MKFRALGALVAVCAVGLLVLTWQRHDGVIEVEAGAVYGAPQLSAERLRTVVEKLGVRTIVNLRGHGRGRTWYGKETEVCSELGIAHYTISFPVDDWPPRYRLTHLLEVLDHAEQAVLMHCRRGVDRTGWASAVVDLAAGRPVDLAMNRLRWWRGHLCRRNRCPQHGFIEAYVAYLENQNTLHSAAVFRSWVAHAYCPPSYNAEMFLLGEPPEIVTAGDRVQLRVRVGNKGSEPWVLSRSKSSGVRVGARILGPFEDLPEDATQRFRTQEGPPVDVVRAGFEEGVVAPGETRDYSLGFAAPQAPGRYLLHVDLVDEGVHWFCEMGWPGQIRPFRVIAVGEVQ